MMQVSATVGIMRQMLATVFAEPSRRLQLYLHNPADACNFIGMMLVLILGSCSELAFERRATGSQRHKE